MPTSPTDDVESVVVVTGAFEFIRRHETAEGHPISISPQTLSCDISILATLKCELQDVGAFADISTLHVTAEYHRISSRTTPYGTGASLKSGPSRTMLSRALPDLILRLHHGAQNFDSFCSPRFVGSSRCRPIPRVGAMWRYWLDRTHDLR